MLCFLVVILFAVAAHAQIEFGPLQFNPGNVCSNPHLRSDAQDQLLYTWGPVTPVEHRGFGQCFTLEGEAVGQRLCYDVVPPANFLCPASVTTLPLSDGKEARLICHS